MPHRKLPQHQPKSGPGAQKQGQKANNNNRRKRRQRSNKKKNKSHMPTPDFNLSQKVRSDLTKQLKFVRGRYRALAGNQLGLGPLSSTLDQGISDFNAPIMYNSVAPRATPAQYKYAADGTVTITKWEYCQAITMSTSGDLKTNIFVLTPQNQTLFPWLATMSSMYEEYKINDMEFRYVHSVPTNVGGNIYFAYDPDGADATTWINSTSISVIQLMSQDGNDMKPVYSDHVYKPKITTTTPWMYCDQYVSPANSADDQRMTTAGVILVAADAVTTGTIGHLWVRSCISFRKPCGTAIFKNLLVSGVRAVQNSFSPFADLDFNTCIGTKPYPSGPAPVGYCSFLNPGFYHGDLQGTWPSTSSGTPMTIASVAGNLITSANSYWQSSSNNFDYSWIISTLVPFTVASFVTASTSITAALRMSAIDASSLYYKMIRMGHTEDSTRKFLDDSLYASPQLFSATVKQCKYRPLSRMLSEPSQADLVDEYELGEEESDEPDQVLVPVTKTSSRSEVSVLSAIRKKK
jgi:hypothetical protein